MHRPKGNPFTPVACTHRRLQFALPKKCPDKQARAHNSDAPQTGDLAGPFPASRDQLGRDTWKRMPNGKPKETRQMVAVRRRASKIKENAIGFHFIGFAWAIVCRRITRCVRPEKKMKTNICSMPRVWSDPFHFLRNIIHHVWKKIKRNFHFRFVNLLLCVSGSRISRRRKWIFILIQQWMRAHGTF